jgi:hypothetical protein
MPTIPQNTDVKVPLWYFEIKKPHFKFVFFKLSIKATMYKCHFNFIFGNENENKNILCLLDIGLVAWTLVLSKKLNWQHQ